MTINTLHRTLAVGLLLMTHDWLAIANAATTPTNESCHEQTLLKKLKADDVSAWQTFMKQCPSLKSDARGFSIFDRARLAGSHNIVKALLKQKTYNENSYTPALGKLLQTGLRFLSFDAGLINGHLSERSIDAIKRYQKKYGFSPDGKLHTDWLADFYHRLVKQTQQQLTNLGFDAGSIDGIIGAKTRTAMQAFRQERQMPKTDYADIDDQLLYQLMMMQNEQHKKALAKRDAERIARRVAQEAARRREIARERAEARRQAEAKRQAAEAAALAAQQKRQQEEQRIQQLKQQNPTIAKPIPQTVQTPIALPHSMPTQAQMAERVRQAELARQAQQKAEEQARLAREQAERDAQLQQAREAEEKRNAAVAAAQAVEARARREAQAAEQSAAKARREAQNAFYAVKRNEPVRLSRDMQQATAISTARPAATGFNELKGTLQFSSATSCTVGGRNIESSWCQSYYPKGKGKQCTVIMSNSGIIISFLCD